MNLCVLVRIIEQKAHIGLFLLEHVLLDRSENDSLIPAFGSALSIGALQFTKSILRMFFLNKKCFKISWL